MAKDKDTEAKPKKKRELSEGFKAQTFKKGQSGNPRGRPVDPPELKLMKKLTRQELIEVGELVIMGKVKELKRLRKSEDCSVLKAMFVSVCLRVLKDGSMENFDKILSRFIGKVKDEVHHSGSIEGGKVLVMLPPNGREKRGHDK